jgi:hypothetical protein
MRQEPSRRVWAANCSRKNWAAPEATNQFGLRCGCTAPFLRQDDVILVRINGKPYGVRAVWYLVEKVPVTANTPVPWKDGKYDAILRCCPVITLPHLFCEQFKGASRESRKIPGLSAGMMHTSIVRLKPPLGTRYIEGIIEHFGDGIAGTFDYKGRKRRVKPFLGALLASLHAEGQQGQLCWDGP